MAGLGYVDVQISKSHGNMTEIGHTLFKDINTLPIVFGSTHKGWKEIDTLEWNRIKVTGSGQAEVGTS